MASPSTRPGAHCAATVEGDLPGRQLAPVHPTESASRMETGERAAGTRCPGEWDQGPLYPVTVLVTGSLSNEHF